MLSIKTYLWNYKHAFPPKKPVSSAKHGWTSLSKCLLQYKWREFQQWRPAFQTTESAFIEYVCIFEVVLLQFSYINVMKSPNCINAQENWTLTSTTDASSNSSSNESMWCLFVIETAHLVIYPVDLFTQILSCNKLDFSIRQFLSHLVSICLINRQRNTWKTFFFFFVNLGSPQECMVQVMATT